MPDGDEAPAQEKQPEPSHETPADAAKSASADDDPDQPTAQPEADGDESDLDDGLRQQVYNIFQGNVQVGEGGTLGFALDVDVRRETGRVSETEITALRGLYLRTETYEDALARLRRHRLVILVGAEDSGRAAAALMLADKVRARGARILRLPPTLSLADLAGKPFKEGQAYVLHDWVAGADASSSLVRFDVTQLANRLDAAGAHLVITASSAARTARAAVRHEVRWAAPDPAALFAHCFGQVDKLVGVEEKLEELEHCAIRLGSPRRVVGLAVRLCDGADEALRSAEDTDRQEVAAWFEEPRPNRRAVRAATVLALACRTGDEPAGAPGVTQRGFEELFFTLGNTETRFRGEKPADEAPLPDDDEVFPQSRQSLLKDAGLEGFTVAAPETAVVGTEHTPGFRTRRLRDLFLEMLNRNYGEELWSPVREWAAEVVSRPRMTDAHLALAFGVGRMARYATKEVREAYLEQWAQGLEVERSCAVFALWSMANADDLAPEALRVATEWVWGRGPERAMTAAITLGGALGKRYPSEAMRWLWRLALRGQRINHLACFAISNLFAIDALSDDPDVIRRLARRAEDALGPSTTMQKRRKILGALLEILAVPGVEADTPAVQRVLRESDAAAEPIGRIWAAILRSRPHRVGGIDALHAALVSLTGTADGTAVATRLGHAILPRLNPVQRRQLEGRLRSPHAYKDRRLAQEVVLAFLTVSAQTVREQSS